MTDTLGDPLWQFAATGGAVEFAPLDLRVRVRATDHELLIWATEVLGPESSAPGEGPTFDLVLVADPDGALAISSVTDGSSMEFRADGAVHRERNGLFVASIPGGGLVTADLDHGRAAAFVERAALQPGPQRLPAAEVLVGAPLWRFAARSGLVALHAAAVVTPAGPVVVRGPSGSGKTTAACVLGLAGCPVLADEVVWVDFLGLQPTLRGSLPFVRTEAAALELLPAMAELVRSPDGAASRRLTREDPRGPAVIPLGPLGLPRAMSARLGPIVFLGPRAASGPGSFRRLAEDVAIARFEEGTIPGELTQDRRGRDKARDALIQHGAFEVNVGNLSALPDLLAAIASAR